MFNSVYANGKIANNNNSNAHFQYKKKIGSKSYFISANRIKNIHIKHTVSVMVRK